MKTIYFDGPIGQSSGEVSAAWFRSQLPRDGSPIEVRFHSEGGSVFEAFAIYDIVSAYPGRKTAVVASVAFSAASLLLCAFDEVEATANSYLMIHSPHFESDADLDLSERKLLANLRNRMIELYSQKTGKPVAFITRAVDQEVFYDAPAAVGLGLVDRILPAKATVKSKAVPSRVLASFAVSRASTAKSRWRAAVDALAMSGISKPKAILEVDRLHPGLRQQMLAEVNRR